MGEGEGDGERRRSGMGLMEEEERKRAHGARTVRRRGRGLVAHVLGKRTRKRGLVAHELGKRKDEGSWRSYLEGLMAHTHGKTKKKRARGARTGKGLMTHEEGLMARARMNGGRGTGRRGARTGAGGRPDHLRLRHGTRPHAGAAANGAGAGPRRCVHRGRACWWAKGGQ